MRRKKQYFLRKWNAYNLKKKKYEKRKLILYKDLMVHRTTIYYHFDQYNSKHNEKNLEFTYEIDIGAIFTNKYSVQFFSYVLNW